MRERLQQLTAARWQGHIAAFLAGILFTTGLSPYDLWFFNLLSVATFLLLLDSTDFRKSLVRSFCYGLGVYLHGMSWVFVSIHTFGNTPLLAAIPLTGAFVITFALIFTLQIALYLKISNPKYCLITFPAIWMLFEWIRSWFLTGCPWLLSGYAYIDTFLAGYAPLFGIYSISYLAILSAALVVYIINQLPHSTPSNRYKATTASIALIGIWLFGALLNQVNWVVVDDSDEARIDVSLIQGNISQDQKWLPETRQPTFNLYQNLTIREIQDEAWQPDLIVWPEAAVPSFHHEAIDFFNRLELTLAQKNTTLITGILSAIPIQYDYLYHNSILAVGNGEGVYHKQKLVPFGEIYPLTEELKTIIPFYGQLNSFTPGSNEQTLLQAGPYSVASYICYEVIYPDLARLQARDADYLLTISNDAWFGRSIAPWQHFQMARMRALENGRFMVRGTNTGVTGVINHKGEIISVANQFEQLTHRESIYPVKGNTPFTLWGSIPIVTAAFILLIAGIILGLRTDRGR